MNFIFRFTSVLFFTLCLASCTNLTKESNRTPQSYDQNNLKSANESSGNGRIGSGSSPEEQNKSQTTFKCSISKNNKLLQAEKKELARLLNEGHSDFQKAAVYHRAYSLIGLAWLQHRAAIGKSSDYLFKIQKDLPDKDHSVCNNRLIARYKSLSSASEEKLVTYISHFKTAELKDFVSNLKSILRQLDNLEETGELFFQENLAEASHACVTKNTEDKNKIIQVFGTKTAKLMDVAALSENGSWRLSGDQNNISWLGHIPLSCTEQSKSDSN